MKLVQYLSIVVGLIGSGQLMAASAEQSTAREPATRILFSEWEPGIDPYITRTLVTPTMMRIDDNADAGNFVLFDRKRRIIYSVSHDDSSILEIHEQAVIVSAPKSLKVTHVAIKDETIPMIGGEKVTHYRISANNQACMQVFTVSRLLNTALQARREFQTVLASEHAANLASTPADMQQDCDLSSNVFFPVYHLQFGFPVHESTNAGYNRQMISFDEQFTAASALFELPAGYSHFSPGMKRRE